MFCFSNARRSHPHKCRRKSTVLTTALLASLPMTDQSRANDNHLLPDAYVHSVSLELEVTGEIVATPQSGDEHAPVSLTFENVYVEGAVKAETGWGRIRTSYLFVGTCGSLCLPATGRAFGTIARSKLHSPGKWKINDRIAGYMESEAFQQTRLSANDTYALIANACERAHRGNVSNQDRSTTVFLPFSVIFETRRPFQGFGYVVTSGTTNIFGVPLRCKAPVRPDIETPDELVSDHGTMSVSAIRLSLRTFANQTTRPTPGRECKRALLKITAETNQAGPVRLQLSEQRNNGPLSTRPVKLQAEHADGQFFAVHEEWIEADRNTNYQVIAKEVTDSTFPQSTPWKRIRLRCEGTPGGGFQSPTNG